MLLSAYKKVLSQKEKIVPTHNLQKYVLVQCKISLVYTLKYSQSTFILSTAVCCWPLSLSNAL